VIKCHNQILLLHAVVEDVVNGYVTEHRRRLTACTCECIMHVVAVGPVCVAHVRNLVEDFRMNI
jgi:hypothetical protein